MPVSEREPAPRWRAVLSVAIVLAIAGLMFTSSARLARGGDRYPQNLAGLVQQRSDEVANLSGQITKLDASLDQLTKQKTVAAPRLTKRLQFAVDVAAGDVDVTGPGVVVTLRDASSGIVPAGAAADDLVVHQQDIQAVVNAMWAGGAEAMSIQGQRVTLLTAVRCVGNVLYLHGQVYSPPYEIAAVGDPSNLIAALGADPTLRIYQEYVDAYGLGWDVMSTTDISIGALDGGLALRYAHVPAGVDVFG